MIIIYTLPFINEMKLPTNCTDQRMRPVRIIEIIMSPRYFSDCTWSLTNGSASTNNTRAEQVNTIDFTNTITTAQRWLKTDDKNKKHRLVFPPEKLLCI